MCCQPWPGECYSILVQLALITHGRNSSRAVMQQSKAMRVVRTLERVTRTFSISWGGVPAAFHFFSPSLKEKMVANRTIEIQ